MSEIVSFGTFAANIKHSAVDVVIRHKKLASFKLYEVLADCMRMVQRCNNNPVDMAEMEALFKSIAPDDGRHYVEKTNYIPNIVCRYVFDGSNRTNIARYSIVLREAEKRQIAPGDLAQYMKDNGGVNEFYFSRPLQSREVFTKNLALTKPVRISRDKPFTLRVIWSRGNLFNVLESSIDD